MERAGRLAAPTGGVTLEEFSVDGISCEWVKPDLAHNPQYVILYAHGGGYTCGGLGYARILAAKLAVSTGFSVVSFEYRLAPEHKYPAAL
ncbi:MAG: alpha/beta hydrolase fold domain-containing protein, partial [Pseudobutyrivibrio sp.]|nr:alpha/beta hydrolase fold domain-containing protein [Pseudobutyrivibrio sp.]